MQKPLAVVLAGVRARQEKVVFVTCEDEELISRTVRPLLGQQVVLDVSTASVTLDPDDGTSSNGGKHLSEESTASTSAAPSASELVCESLLDVNSSVVPRSIVT